MWLWNHTQSPQWQGNCYNQKSVSDKITQITKLMLHEMVLFIRSCYMWAPVVKELYFIVMQHLTEALEKKQPDAWASSSWLLYHETVPTYALSFQLIFGKNICSKPGSCIPFFHLKESKINYENLLFHTIGEINGLDKRLM